MKQLFVPYEIALKLKEKGFDEPCLGWIASDGFLSVGIRLIKNTNCAKEHCAAPLYQQVVDWFRDKHKIVVYPDYRDCNSRPVYCIKWWDKVFKEMFVDSQDKAIEKALELI